MHVRQPGPITFDDGHEAGSVPLVRQLLRDYAAWLGQDDDGEPITAIRCPTRSISKNSSDIECREAGVMLIKWLVVASVATVAYHLIMKVTPAAANPFLMLAATYTLVAVTFIVLFFVTPGGVALGESVRVLNWTALALAAAVVCLDLGFLMLYRTGFDVSLGQLITQSVATLALLLIGVAWFQERLTAGNIGGILLCVVGLWLVSRR
jgi:multidrug transporter EmrE-like cation transporter